MDKMTEEERLDLLQRTIQACIVLVEFAENIPEVIKRLEQFKQDVKIKRRNYDTSRN